MRLHLFALLFAAACGSGSSTKTGGTTTTPTDNSKMFGGPAAPAAQTKLDLKLGVSATHGDKTWAIQQNETLKRCDLMELYIDIEQPAYVYVLQFLPDGTPQMLFPAKGTDQMMKPGTKIRIPEDDSIFQIVGTGGENVVYVLMSREPIDKVDASITTSIKNIRTTTDSTPASLDCEEKKQIASNDKTTTGGTGNGGGDGTSTGGLGTPPGGETKGGVPGGETKGGSKGTTQGGSKGGGKGERVAAAGGGESRDKFLGKLKSRGDFNARQIKVIKRPNAGSIVHVTAQNASDTLLVADFTFKHTE